MGPLTARAGGIVGATIESDVIAALAFAVLTVVAIVGPTVRSWFERRAVARAVRAGEVVPDDVAAKRSRT